MIGRLSREEVENIKENLLVRLNLPFFRIADSLYDIGAKRVNIKVTSPRASGRYWFGIQRKDVDSYVWICYNPEMQTLDAYYWIPAREMWNLISAGSYRDRIWEKKGRQIPNFEIDTKLNLYIGGGMTKISIEKFRNLQIPPLL